MSSHQYHFKHLQCCVLCMCVCVSDPSAVTALQVDNELSTHSLWVSWRPAVGIYDGYKLQLLDESERVMGNTNMPADTSRHLFSGLIPGSWYKVSIQTLSSTSKSKEVTAEGQTGKI